MALSDKIKTELQSAIGKREHVEADIEKNHHGDFNERVALFARLEHWRRDLEQCLKFCKDASASLAPGLQEDMGENGIQNLNVEGLTIFQSTKFFCSKKADKDGVTTEAICQALRDLGFDYMVAEGYNPSSLKSKVREWLDEGVDIPEPLNEMLNYGEEIVLVSRK